MIGGIAVSTETNFFLSEDMQRENILKQIEKLDALLALKYNNIATTVIIVGGSALILLNAISRGSRDIDILECSNEVMQFLPECAMNSDARAYLDCFPADYKSRLIEIPTACINIRVFTPSLEDIVISKLASSRPKDDVDIRSHEIMTRIDLNKLADIVSSGIVQEGFLSDHTVRAFEIDYAKYVNDVKRYRHEL